jgi:hypothetical protein
MGIATVGGEKEGRVILNFDGCEDAGIYFALRSY